MWVTWAGDGGLVVNAQADNLDWSGWRDLRRIGAQLEAIVSSASNTDKRSRLLA